MQVSSFNISIHTTWMIKCSLADLDHMDYLELTYDSNVQVGFAMLATGGISTKNMRGTMLMCLRYESLYRPRANHTHILAH